MAELGLEPLDRAEREGIVSWDVRLDGVRRTGLRVTLIFEPRIGAIVWAHYAPSITDGLRASYRRLLRWNDEFPFVKFALAEDGRPILSSEIPGGQLSLDELGLALARILAVSDALLEETRVWLWPGGKGALPERRSGAGAALLRRYAERLGDLVPPEADVDAPAASVESLVTAE